MLRPLIMNASLALCVACGMGASPTAGTTNGLGSAAATGIGTQTNPGTTGTGASSGGNLTSGMVDAGVSLTLDAGIAVGAGTQTGTGTGLTASGTVANGDTGTLVVAYNTVNGSMGVNIQFQDSSGRDQEVTQNTNDAPADTVTFSELAVGPIQNFVVVPRQGSFCNVVGSSTPTIFAGQTATITLLCQ